MASLVAQLDLHEFSVSSSALLCPVSEVHLRDRGEKVTLT